MRLALLLLILGTLSVLAFFIALMAQEHFGHVLTNLASGL